MALQIAMVNVHLRLGDTATAEWRLAQWQGAVRQAGASALLESLPSRWREDALAEPVRMDTLHGLTVKERLILQGVARGQSNKEIAKALGVSPETIKTHMKNIFGKLGVSSRTHAAALITQGHGLMLAIEGESPRAVLEFRKHLGWYTRGLPGSAVRCSPISNQRTCPCAFPGTLPALPYGPR